MSTVHMKWNLVQNTKIWYDFPPDNLQLVRAWRPSKKIRCIQFVSISLIWICVCSVPENGGQSPSVMLDAAESAAIGNDARFHPSSSSSSSAPVSELRATTPEKAAFFLDAALAARTSQRQNQLSGHSQFSSIWLWFPVFPAVRFKKGIVTIDKCTSHILFYIF